MRVTRGLDGRGACAIRKRRDRMDRRVHARVRRRTPACKLHSRLPPSAAESKELLPPPDDARPHRAECSETTVHHLPTRDTRYSPAGSEKSRWFRSQDNPRSRVPARGQLTVEGRRTPIRLRTTYLRSTCAMEPATIRRASSVARPEARETTRPPRHALLLESPLSPDRTSPTPGGNTRDRERPTHRVRAGPLLRDWDQVRALFRRLTRNGRVPVFGDAANVPPRYWGRCLASCAASSCLSSSSERRPFRVGLLYSEIGLGIRMNAVGPQHDARWLLRSPD